MRRALLSVTDKTGITEFAKGLVDLGFEILSTGGTAHALQGAGIPVTEVADVTGFPEILSGRVKTLHPKIHAGILADIRNAEHRAQVSSAGIEPIELVCVNLYAFAQTIAKSDSAENAIESIDIGGPAMIRAAAKNHANVWVVVDPADYGEILEQLKRSGEEEARRKLAAKAFRLTAFYDSLISRYFSDRVGEKFPERLSIGYSLAQSLRYGENPHQSGALYADPLQSTGIAHAKQIWGKELSYNNLLDGDAAWGLATDLPKGSVVIIKHGNPCGAAMAATVAESFRLAKETDPVSAFGGVAACHGVVDEATARAMTEKGNFLEIVLGTSFESSAAEIFRTREGWGQSVRLLEVGDSGSPQGMTIRSIGGGALVQETDFEPVAEWTVVTKNQPTPEQYSALELQWTIAKQVKSNAIVVGDSVRMLGIGAGQMNRVQSVRLALEQAGEEAVGAVLASDAFFPFPDSIEAAAAAGISAIIQPGGSKKDQEVIDAANHLGTAMVLTGVRHFRH